MYKNKYLKYKNKYLELKVLLGGANINKKIFHCSNMNELSIIIDDNTKHETNLDKRATIRKEKLIAILDEKSKIGLTKENFCDKINWNRDYKAIGTCKWIPLKNICNKQFVVGRVAVLTDYYECGDNFITLKHNDWTISLNDLFVYCAFKNTIVKDKNFPIRLVTDNKDGILSVDRDKGINDINITNREVCQILLEYKASFYQSKEYPHLFFITFKKLADIITHKDNNELGKEVTYTLTKVYNPVNLNKNLFSGIRYKDNLYKNEDK